MKKTDHHYIRQATFLLSSALVAWSFLSAWTGPGLPYNAYFTVLGLHIQKLALGSLSLGVAAFTIIHLNYSRATSRHRNAWKVIAAIWILVCAVPIRTLVTVHQKVENGTLVEIAGSQTPLMAAAYNGDLTEVERLIKSGANVNERNEVGNTALHFAAGMTPEPNQSAHGSANAVSQLIHYGANINAQNRTEITPLIDAVYAGNLASVKLLVSHGADFNKVTKYHSTALTEAIIRQDTDIAKFLLQHPVDLGFRDFTGRTALESAEKLRETEVVKAIRAKMN